MFGCQEKAVQPIKLKSDTSSFSTTDNLQKEDDFSDLKEEKDEGCTEKEELEKKASGGITKSFSTSG